MFDGNSALVLRTQPAKRRLFLPVPNRIVLQLKWSCGVADKPVPVSLAIASSPPPLTPIRPHQSNAPRIN